MSTLDATRAELALVILYLNKPKAREKICKAIQYGLKFWSDGQPGTAQNVDKSTSLARKVFHLFKSVNDLHALISPAPQGTPLPLILLGKRIGWKLVYVDHENDVLLVGMILGRSLWTGYTASRSFILKKSSR
ncbi:peroxisomal membrane protein 11C isoform X3 [Vitis vinifera]|uniref:peroxisomal membrane protein 11C isoform X3 n=1 Tax=Vitis vinifera TaxID=29760 RepID=UPI00053FE42A|nr:peroxisomal membrane protein 11C isoform X3 [Vitis vinifera]XP_010649101.1 peroxisomal membrane protein 11C isoform X3 [Vitis vinifera]XP_019074747.1 peroxisomal membrane protein 11C isoform X3 [Vitis vinifera]|eukprot:XP_010649100.1 PREDICTED: peroxisomal membrane protein 11C [Vitis vinifera]